MKIAKFVEILKLFEVYQNCLSLEQFRVLSSFLEQGFEPTEIAENSSISRQAVNKTLNTAIKKHENLENKLKFLQFRENFSNSLDKIAKLVENGNTKQALLEIQVLKES